MQINKKTHCPRCPGILKRYTKLQHHIITANYHCSQCDFESSALIAMNGKTGIKGQKLTDAEKQMLGTWWANPKD